MSSGFNGRILYGVYSERLNPADLARRELKQIIICPFFLKV